MDAAECCETTAGHFYLSHGRKSETGCNLRLSRKFETEQLNNGLRADEFGHSDMKPLRLVCMK